MKTILAFAAFALAAAFSHQALACDYHPVNASAQNSTVVACAGDTCKAEQQTSEKQQSESRGCGAPQSTRPLRENQSLRRMMRRAR